MKDLSKDELMTLMEWYSAYHMAVPNPKPEHQGLYYVINQEYMRRLEQESLSFEDDCAGGACKL